MDYVTFQMSLPIDLKERLRNIQSQTGIPMSKIIRDVLEQHLGEIEAKFAIQAMLPHPSGDKK